MQRNIFLHICGNYIICIEQKDNHISNFFFERLDVAFVIDRLADFCAIENLGDIYIQNDEFIITNIVGNINFAKQCNSSNEVVIKSKQKLNIGQRVFAKQKFKEKKTKLDKYNIANEFDFLFTLQDELKQLNGSNKKHIFNIINSLIKKEDRENQEINLHFYQAEFCNYFKTICAKIKPNYKLNFIYENDINILWEAKEKFNDSFALVSSDESQRIIIEPTEAACLVDIDLKNQNIQNIDISFILEKIVNIIRLKNISGKIIIDIPFDVTKYGKVNYVKTKEKIKKKLKIYNDISFQSFMSGCIIISREKRYPSLLDQFCEIDYNNFFNKKFNEEYYLLNFFWDIEKIYRGSKVQRIKLTIPEKYYNFLHDYLESLRKYFNICEIEKNKEIIFKVEKG